MLHTMCRLWLVCTLSYNHSITVVMVEVLSVKRVRWSSGDWLVTLKTLSVSYCYRWAIRARCWTTDSISYINPWASSIYNSYPWRLWHGHCSAGPIWLHKCNQVSSTPASSCFTHFFRVNDDGAGDGKNSKIVQKLMPDRDYFVQIQTFDPKGGKFEFSITAW